MDGLRGLRTRGSDRWMRAAAAGRDFSWEEKLRNCPPEVSVLARRHLGSLKTGSYLVVFCCAKRKR